MDACIAKLRMLKAEEVGGDAGFLMLGEFIDGVSGMRYVMEIAFCDAFPHVPVGDGTNSDRDALAVYELNLAWSGIGEWLH